MLLVLLSLFIVPSIRLSTRREMVTSSSEGINFYINGIDVSAEHVVEKDIKNKKIEIERYLKQENFKCVLEILERIFVSSRTREKYDRFSDILPYSDNVSKTYDLEYINASFINLHNRKLLIAAQQPHINYLQLFRKFIEKSDVTLIICLTEVSKEEDYFAESELVSRKRIKFQNSDLIYDEIYNFKGRSVRRLRYLKWPDYGTPDLNEFISFYEYFLKINFNVGIVHCKAGVGRTGTFIMYYILDLLRTNTTKDFSQILLYLRFNRPKMVMTTSQIEFLYKAFKLEREARK